MTCSSSIQQRVTKVDLNITNIEQCHPEKQTFSMEFQLAFLATFWTVNNHRFEIIMIRGA